VINNYLFLLQIYITTTFPIWLNGVCVITGTVRETGANLDFCVVSEPRDNEQRDQQLPAPVANIRLYHHRRNLDTRELMLF
jgi:hypothetical protein